MSSFARHIHEGSLGNVRFVLLVLIGLAATSSFGQHLHGTYHSGSSSAAWEINGHCTLIWDSKPYLPVGTIVSSVPEIERASKEGISDFLVDVPASGAGWAELLSALHKAHARYLIRINSLAPMSKGIAIEPQGYRFTGITATRSLKVDLVGATSALAVLVQRRDGLIISSKKVPVVNGVLNYTVKVDNGIEHVLLLYPESTSAELPDFWEAFDLHRDQLLESIHVNHLDDGLRGIVNPIGHVVTLPGRDFHFVPTNPFFRIELKNFLVERYKNLETALRLWALGPNTIQDFDELARLVPLWNGTRGISMLYDPQADKLISCFNQKSAIWTDIEDVVAIANVKRFQLIVEALHSTVDVPVIQEWSGWATAYEMKQAPLDGIGVKTVGTAPSAILDTASRAASSMLRWSKPGWLPATDVDLGPSTDPKQLPEVVDDILSLGSKGLFIRAEKDSELKAVAAESTRLTASPPDANFSPSPVFFPENAINPASPQRLPGGRIWIPSPMDGNRVDFGAQFFGYRYEDVNGDQYALWSLKQVRVKLFMSKPDKATFTTLDGSDAGVKILRDGVEITIGPVPILISGINELPVPGPCLEETLSHYNQIMALLDARHADAPEEAFAFTDANQSFKTSPGASFEKMRDQLRRLSIKVASYTWIEAEKVKSTNFSEAIAIPSCSAGFALALRTQLPSEGEGFFADYDLVVRSKENQSVWLAAKIPAERRQDVSVIVGSQNFSVSGDPISLYGNGFGWFKLGVTRLAGTNSKLRISVRGDSASDMAFDTVLLTPNDFAPNGIFVPDPIPFKSLQFRPEKPRKIKP